MVLIYCVEGGGWWALLQCCDCSVCKYQLVTPSERSDRAGRAGPLLVSSAQ